VNSPQRALELVELGVDYLITDRPEVMRKLIEHA